MGTFAGLFREGSIPENKKMNFFYNYFEESFWENAGFDKESLHIWSGKIGWNCFHEAVVAAYVLESLYLDGLAAPAVDGELIATYRYTGWINYLFQEHFLLKNRDPWQLFELLHERKAMEDYGWGGYTYDGYAAIGYLEIRAVLEGTDAAIGQSKPLSSVKVNKKVEKNITPIEAIVHAKHLIEGYRKSSSLNAEEQLSLLLGMIRASYEQDVFALMDQYEDERLKDILLCAFRSEVPAFIIKVLAETYDKDFWELWTQNKDVVRRWMYRNETFEVLPISTAEFFWQDPDDMILFWEENGSIEFSDDLKKWFMDLKIRYDELVKTNFIIENPLNWIVNLMEYADENYYRIYTMTDFFEETVEHLTDSRYQVLWKVYDEMLHDPEIFVRADKKKNKARVTLRRYMALVANRKLRQNVFGF